MIQKAIYNIIMDVRSKNKRNESMLKVKVTLGDRSIKIPTNIFVRQDQFKDEGVINHVQAKGLNAMLAKYIIELQSIEIEAFKKNVDFTLQMLYTSYVEKITSSTPLIDFCKHVMDYCTNRKRITKQKYFDVVKEIEKYHPKVCLEDIDIMWLKKFEADRLNKGNNDSTVWSMMKCLRALFNEAIKRDLLKPNQNPFRLYEIPEIRSRHDVLMFSEIEELELMGFPSATERRIRDIFCFACYTGLRWGDLQDLKNDYISTTGGITWLKLKTKKTGSIVQIPLSIIFFGNALRILDKYGGDVEEMMKYTCNSSINRSLKDLLKKTDIGGNQRISFHTARRSCLTGLADFGVPIQTIMKIAGHSRINTTTKYVQLSTGMIQKDLENAFCNGKGVKTTHVELKRDILKVTVTGKKLFVGSEIMRCKNCSFFEIKRCKLFHTEKKTSEWCDCFTEKLDKEGKHYGRIEKKRVPKVKDIVNESSEEKENKEEFKA